MKDRGTPNYHGYDYELPVGYWLPASRKGKPDRRCLAVLSGEGRCICGTGHIDPHKAGDSSGMTHFLTSEMLSRGGAG